MIIVWTSMLLMTSSGLTKGAYGWDTDDQRRDDIDFSDSPNIFKADGLLMFYLLSDYSKIMPSDFRKGKVHTFSIVVSWRASTALLVHLFVITITSNIDNH